MFHHHNSLTLCAIFEEANNLFNTSIDLPGMIALS